MADVEIPKQHKAIIYDEPGKASVKITEVNKTALRCGVWKSYQTLTHSSG